MHIRTLCLAGGGLLVAFTAAMAASGAGGGGTFTPAGKGSFTPAGKTAPANSYAAPTGGTGWTFGAVNTKNANASQPGNYAPSSNSTAYRFGALAANGGAPNCGPGSPSGLPCPEGATAIGGVRRKG